MGKKKKMQQQRCEQPSKVYNVSVLDDDQSMTMFGPHANRLDSSSSRCSHSNENVGGSVRSLSA